MEEARDGKVGALLHGLAVLDLFERDRTVVAVADIARNLGVHRSTASRLASTLASAGYLQAAGGPGRYRLAPKLATLGEIAAADADLRRVAAGPLRELVSQLGETTHLGILDGTEAVTIDVVDGWQTVRMHSWVGKRSPAHCSSIGKALLAELSPEDFAARYPGPDLEARTSATITSTDELRKHLELVRTRGYAEDFEELEPHLCCVAAPVLGREGPVVASISISGPASRLRDPAALAAAAAAVRATARVISTRLGAPTLRLPATPATPLTPPAAALRLPATPAYPAGRRAPLTRHPPLTPPVPCSADARLRRPAVAHIRHFRICGKRMLKCWSLWLL